MHSLSSPSSSSSSSLLLLIYQKNLFSVYLDSTPGDLNSSVDFGEINSAHYTGEITWVPITTEGNFPYFPLFDFLFFPQAGFFSPLDYWSINLDNIQVGSTSVGDCDGVFSYCSAIVDTGTSLIVGPEDAVNDLLSAIGTVNSDWYYPPILLPLDASFISPPAPTSTLCLTLSSPSTRTRTP